jgi:hypothetical protein
LQSSFAVQAFHAALHVPWNAVAQVVQSLHEPVSHASTLVGAPLQKRPPSNPGIPPPPQLV